jgi:carbamoyl-phosphate synthase large subunit
MAALSRVAQYDFYHLPQYHEIAERNGEGRAQLFVQFNEEHVIALPLLIRQCNTIPGLQGFSALDATSAYGYVGPVSSDPVPPAPFIAGFQSELRDVLGTMKVTSLFTRLHPLLSQVPLVAGLGEIEPAGTTVSIDLTLPEEEQAAGLRLNHVRNIRRLLALGGTCSHDTSRSLDEFAGIYYETMRRVGAAPRYFFKRDYFTQLDELRGSLVHLFTCLLEGEVVAAGLFFACEGIVQYHLGATRTGYEALGPMKLVLDTARLWASRHGMKILHLGGGVGAQEDSLFRFKTGFSRRRHPYATWRWLIDEERYDRMNKAKADWNAKNGVGFISTEYFPLYRGDTEPPRSQSAARPNGRVTSSEHDSEHTRHRPSTAVDKPSLASPDQTAEPPNVLVTAAGRRTTLVRAFVDAARTRGGRTYAADVDPLAPALYLADEAVRIRPTNDSSYIADLIQIVERHGIRLLVPTIDPDLPVLARVRTQFGLLGCVVAVSSESFVDLVFDKYAMYLGLSAHGVALAKSWLPEDARGGMPDRLYVKPRRGSGSTDNHIVARRDLDLILPLVTDPIVQELLEGPEITIDAMLSLDGLPVHFVPRRRIRTLAGESIQGVTLEHDPDLEAWITHILEICGSLGAAGPLCLQAFLTSRGPVLSEVNARFGGGFPLGLAAGGNYAELLLDMIDGVPVPSRLGMYEAGLFMTRYHVEHFTRSPRW